MTVANWLATYWIHSTIALGAAWLLERCLPHRLRIIEAAWKVALVAGLVTATLQLSLDIHPLGGRRRLPWYAPAQAQAVTIPFAAPRVHRAVHPIPMAHVVAPSVVKSHTPWGLTLFVGSWALGGGLALGGLLYSWRRFARRLADRRELADLRVHAALSALEEVSGSRYVRLTQSAAVDVPVALGVVGREICVPERALSELDGEQIDALLAHELAHLTRRDPAWLLLSSLISRAFLLQPLNFLAARRVASYAELACDDLAAEWTRRPLALAHCLADVAGWLVEPRAALVAPAMAGQPSLLRRRVERLLARRGGPESLPRWFPTAAVVAVVAALAFAPSCASWEEGSPPHTHAAMAAPPPPLVAGTPTPQLAIIAEPVPGVVVAPHHRHHVKVHPVIVQADEDDGDDEDACPMRADNDNDDADDDDDDADDEVSSALEDLPEQIADAMEQINEAREAISAETIAELQKDVEQAMQEARRSMPSRAQLVAQVEQQMRKAMAEAHQSIERARKNLPQREELERVKEEVRRAVEEARRGMEHDNHRGDLERLEQEIERSKRETERLKEERRRLREQRWD
jgi:beta-lactamase regulating signal transducer with metallopeptidase domain